MMRTVKKEIKLICILKTVINISFFCFIVENLVPGLNLEDCGDSLAIIPVYVCTSIVGWSDFEKYATLFYTVPNCCRTPTPKFHVLMLPFHFVAGPQKF